MFKGLKIHMEIGKNWVEPEVRIRADEEEIGAQIAEQIGRAHV